MSDPIAAAFRRALLAASAQWPPGAVPPALAVRLVTSGRWTGNSALAEVARLPKALDRLRALPEVAGVAGVADVAAARAGFLDAALDEALADAYDPAGALVRLAGLAPEMLPWALEAVRAEPAGRLRTLHIGQLAAEATAADLPVVLPYVNAIVDVPYRVRTLVLARDRLPHDVRSELERRALADARAVTATNRRAEALAHLAPHAGEAVAAEAFATARLVKDAHRRFGVLVAVAPHLPADLRPAALAEARRPTAPKYRAALLLALGEPVEALDAVRSAETAGHVTFTAAAVLALADGPLRAAPDPGGLAGELLAELRDLDNEDSVHTSHVARELAPIVPLADPRDVLATARRIAREGGRGALLTALGATVPTDLMPELLADVGRCHYRDVRAGVLTALAPRLPDDLLDAALAAATRHTDAELRAYPLAALVAQLPPADRTAALLAALPPTEEPLAWTHAGLVGHLAPDARAAVVAAARAVPDREDRSFALARLAPSGLVAPAEARRHLDRVDDEDHLEQVISGRGTRHRPGWPDPVAALDSAPTRQECLSIAEVLGPALSASGGAAAVVEAVAAIRAAGP